MLSTDYMSAETSSTKVTPISGSGRWVCMFAGSPSIYTRILRTVYGRLSDGPESITNVLVAFEKSFQDELRMKIEGELLSPYGLTRQMFFERGREYFGDEEFIRIVDRINTTKLETDFIVAGFDPEGSPQLFSLTDPGISEDRLGLGFHAIGTGWMRALGSLYGTYSTDLSTIDLIYRVCEAKFLGEIALGVGKRTFVDVIAPDGTHRGLNPDRVEFIRRIWQKRGIPAVPRAAWTKISQTLHEIGWTMTESGRPELQIGFKGVDAEVPEAVKEVMRENSRAVESLTNESPC